MSKSYKKLLKSIAKEWEKAGLLHDADLSSVAGGTQLILFDPAELDDEELLNAPTMIGEIKTLPHGQRISLLQSGPNVPYDIVQYEQEDGTWGPMYKVRRGAYNDV